MASPASTSSWWCTTPAPSVVLRRATTAPGCTTMPTKSPYQSSSLSGSRTASPAVPCMCSSGRQACAAIARAMASVSTRSLAPWNSFSARKWVHSRRRRSCSVLSSAQRNGWAASVVCHSVSGTGVGWRSERGSRRCSRSIMAKARGCGARPGRRAAAPRRAAGGRRHPSR